ncbi:Trichocyst matrix protein T4-A [Paramecium bursaria]
MAKFIALIAVALVLVAAKPQKSENTKEILTQINKDSFGNSILSVIQLQLSTGGPVGEIQILLNNIASQLNNDQKKADKVHESDTAAFTKLIQDLEQEIAYQQAQIEAVTRLRDDTTEALAEAEKEVRVATTDIENNEKSFASEQALRAEQHATWQRKDEEHVDQIDAIDEASKIVQHLQAGVAFAQVKSRFEKVQAKLMESKHALFKPLISALTQLASKVDNKSIIKILNLLAQIRQQLVASRASLLATEEKQAANWANQSAHLQEEHKRLSERKAFLEFSIVQFKQTISDAIEDLEDHTLFLEDAEDSLQIQQRWTESQEAEYEAQTFERQNQLDIVERLQEHISQKLSATSEFIQVREEVY